MHCTFVPNLVRASRLAADGRGKEVKVELRDEATNMRDQTSTLQLGDTLPEFDLGAANREGRFRLRELLAQGPLMIEFLRGTW